MGHIVEILVVSLIGLAIFGPKMLQSMAREAGKTTSQVKNLKDKFTKEVSSVTDQLPRMPQVPLNSRQAMDMVLRPDRKEERKEPPAKAANTDQPVTEAASAPTVSKEAPGTEEARKASSN